MKETKPKPEKKTERETERRAQGEPAARMDPVHALKIRAEILHSRLAVGDPAARARLRVLPELKRVAPGVLDAKAGDMRRKHCLAVVARECGFSSWEHARRALGGDLTELDLGTLLYGADGASSGMLNVWFTTYDAAQASLQLQVHSADGSAVRRYLLAYKRDFFLTEAPFIETLGLDPRDPDWEAIGWDWGRPLDPGARARLYCKRLYALRTEGGAL